MPINITQDVNGWSVIPTPAGTRYFVDPVGGSDSNDGSTGSRFKTLNKAAQAVTTGTDDQICLTEGATFNNAADHFDSLQGKVGLSTTNPIIIFTENWDVNGATGGRAKITTSNKWLLRANNTPQTKNIAFIGIETYQENYVGTTPALMVYAWKGSLHNLWFEDVYCHDRGGPQTGVSSDIPYTGARDRWDFYRCVIDTCWSANGHAQNLFSVNHCDVKLNQCYLMHGGWHDTLKAKSIFNRNIYTSMGSDMSYNIQECGLFQGASENQLRAGGTINNCIIENNPFSLAIGESHGNATDGNSTTRAAGHSSYVTNNIFMDSEDIGESVALGRGLDVMMAHVTEAQMGVFSGNIMTRDGNSTANQNGLWLGTQGRYNQSQITNPQVLDNGLHNVTVENNIFYDVLGNALWLQLDRGVNYTVSNVVIRNNRFHVRSNTGHIIYQVGVTSGVTFELNDYWHDTRLQTDSELIEYNGMHLNFDEWKAMKDPLADWVDPAYSDPTRNLARYANEVISPPLAATREAFYGAVRTWRKGNYDAALLPGAVADWIRDGFGEAAVPPEAPPAGTVRLRFRVV